MGTLTAMILVGKGSGIGGFNPTHFLFLSENSRPAWILAPKNYSIKPAAPEERITWIPTVENMLEDALLMIAIYVLKDKEITELAGKYFNNKRKNWFELYTDINKKDLEKLYKKCRGIGEGCRVSIMVFEDSTIYDQLKVLENYKMDTSACIPKRY